MVQSSNRTPVVLLLALSLAACTTDKSHDDHDDNDDNDVDAATNAYTFPADDMFDAASCDPLVFEHMLEATPANIALGGVPNFLAREMRKQVERARDSCVQSSHIVWQRRGSA